MIVPPPVRPGDVVRVVAPSGPFETALGLRGLAWLGSRYRVRFDRGAFARQGYLAGSDARRRGELEAALADEEARAVLTFRGGYGATRFVHALDWAAFARAPKWLVGFSDATALHVEAAAHGVASLHAANVAGLGRGDARARSAVVRALEAPLAETTFSGLVALSPGAGAASPCEATGPLFGGNLTMLHTVAAAGRLRVPDGAILVLEDVTERPYRIDRMLTSLEVGGHFARAAGVVFGDFTGCEPGPHGVDVFDVLANHFAGSALPAARGLPVGHGARNEPLVLGVTARLVVRADGSASLTSNPRG